MFKFAFDDAAAAKPPAPPPIAATKSGTPPRAHPFPAAARLRAVAHDAVPLCASALLLRKSIARPPPHLSPSGADIVPAAYEGGYKLWECALDLAEHLHAAHRPALAGKAVLELGAGHAFPAIVAARSGATTVHVQDYNPEVLDDVTAPNLLANVPRSEGVVQMFAGSWHGLPDVLGRTYDLVLSSDTVYAPAQIDQLAVCLLAVLAEGGLALVAGKSYYFGVGGGTREFAKRLREMDKGVTVQVVKEIRDGCSNVREILEIRR